MKIYNTLKMIRDNTITKETEFVRVEELVKWGKKTLLPIGYKWLKDELSSSSKVQK